MNLREATPSDRPAILALARTSLAEFGLEFGVGAATDSQLEAVPGSYADHGGMFWVMTEGEQLLGMAGMFPVGDRILELRKMYFAKAARGRGLGRLMLARCLDFARERDAQSVVLDTMDAMQGAIALYEKAGFVRDDTQITAPRCERGYRLDL